MQKEHRPVRQLSVDVARKIAAGEVIDRPAAIVRELLDNAVDSEATSINVEIKGGGIDSIRVADNGSGMSPEDLSACARPHCTSKIIQAEDLLNLSTLGFRGEALASIAAVSRLTISSGTKRMHASITEDHIIETIPPIQNGQGTIVMSEGLFENFPARRHFLKRPASETLLCREVFIEKALPRTDISFRLSIDGSIRHDLPANVSLSERFTRALELKESPALFTQLDANGSEADGKSKWSFKLIIGEASIYRSDRKHIYIFVNGRRVQEYSLLQAIEYGCQGFFPNGMHPVAALFLSVDPHLVDFNIHPAKKEVRFKDISAVHHGLSSTVRAYFKSYGIKNPYEREKEVREREESEKDSLFKAADSNFTAASFSKIAEEALNSSKPSSLSKEKNQSKEAFSFASPSTSPSGANFQISHQESEKGIISSRINDFNLASGSEKSQDSIIQEDNSKNSIRFMDTSSIAEKRFSIPGSSLAISQKSSQEEFIYYGTLFGTFLMVQQKGIFYLIDQHAAHERIIFNSLMAGGSEKQELLVPYEIKTQSKADDDYLESIQLSLSTAGFNCKKVSNGLWHFTSIPARWKGNQGDLYEAIFSKRVSPQEIIYQIAAMTSCKAAVKDGTILGPEAAEKLAKEALALKDPHCPHGRPVWTTLTKEELFDRVRRTR